MTARWMVGAAAQRRRSTAAERRGGRDAERPRVAFGPKPSVLLGAAPEGRCLLHTGAFRRPAHTAVALSARARSPVSRLPTSAPNASRSDARAPRGGGLRPTSPGGANAVALGVERM